jgi:hypothetical protein
MKKSLIIFSIIICSILLVINFYQYLFVFEVNYKTKEKLFNDCSQEISTNGIPMTAKEWQKQNPAQKPYYVIKMLEIDYEPNQKLIELATSLGDIVDAKHKKSFFGDIVGSNPMESYQVYYGYKGDLLFFEKSASNNYVGICRYNNTGNLIEASYWDDELYYTFTPKEHLMFRCYMGSCEKDLIRYKKSKL